VVEGPTAIKVDGVWAGVFRQYRDKKYGVIARQDFVTWED